MIPADRVRFWKWVHAVLFALFLLSAVLNMLHLRAGFLTNHLADLVVPAWLYVVFRGLHRPDAPGGMMRRSIGSTPEIAAIGLYVASTATEVAQIKWPKGVFAGRFDPWDIVAYGVGLLLVYLANKRWPPTRAAMA